MSSHPRSWRARKALVLVALASTTSLTGLVTPAAAATTGTPAARTPEPPHVSQWWYDAMGLRTAHRTSTGKGVVVAVIDGYLDPRVPDLRGADISVRTDCDGRKVPLLQDERADHGTAMTTAIVGQGTGNGRGGRGVLGVAPDASVRFYSIDTDPSKKLVECDGAATGPMIVKAARDGADIISMSVGGLYGLEKDVRRAQQLGAVVVAASGERDQEYASMDSPAEIPGVVAVSAGDARARPWVRNPRPLAYLHQYPTITAPGVATELGGYTSASTWTSGATRTGTSGATAVTAGAFALLKSRWPEATNNQLIQDVIHWPGDDAKGSLTYTSQVGYGVLSVNNVLPVDPTRWPDVNPLLQEPRAAVKAFPASAYGTTDPSPSSEPPGQAGASGTSSGADSGSQGTQDHAASSTEQGVPPWASPVGLVVLLGAAGAAYAVRRRRTTPDVTSGRPVPETVPSSNHHRDQGE